MDFESIRLFSEIYSKPETAENTALIWDGTELTFGQLRQAVELCASDLIRMGVRPDDHVALLASNSPNWMIAFFAIVRVGAVAVLMNYILPPQHIIPLMTFTDVGFLVCGPCKAPTADAGTIGAVVRELHLEQRVYDFSKTDFAARLAAGERPGELPPEQTDPRRTSVIIFTTGTTAIPKAVMLSQYSILGVAKGCIASMREHFRTTERGFCLALPLFHSYGLTTALSFLAYARKVYVISRLTPDTVMDHIRQYHIYAVGSVGTLYLGMLANPQRFATDVAPYAGICIVGGEFTDPKHILAAAQAYPHLSFLVGYGQTEASPIITLNRPADGIETRARSVGRPLPGIRVKITSPADGRELPVGQEGEVLTQGPGLMNGYYKLPPQQQTVDADGWLHTGDLGRLDENGFLYLTGRLKDIIIKNGENISPAEIENALRQCDGVRDARVLGIPNPACGEEIEACLIMENGVSFDEEHIRRQLCKFLTRFKMPAHFFTFDLFPIAPTGKLDVRELRDTVCRRLQAFAGQQTAAVPRGKEE